MSAVDTVANVVYLALSLIMACATLYGLARKAYLGRVISYPSPPANRPTV
jgi:hypothetical protein